MKSHEYLGYIIKVEAIQTWSSQYWEGRAYIESNKSGRLQIVPLYGPLNTFTTKDEAERHILEEAQKWVDERIDS